MSQQVNVDRKLVFKSDATRKPNVEGSMKEVRKHITDNFMRLALDSTNLWAVATPGTSDSIAISEVEGGSCLITTGTVDDDSCMLASPIIFTDTKKSEFEVKIKISDVSGTAMFVGFSDAKSEANNSIAIHYAADALTTVATNAVGFVVDADSTTLGASSLLCCGVNADTDKTTVDTGITWADGETKTLRIYLDENEDAWFYVDGACKGRITDAVASGTLLCFTIQVMTRADDGSNTVYAYRFDAWMDE